MDTWEKAMRLERFIRFYIPLGFREPIHVFDFIPAISEKNYDDFATSFKARTLAKNLETYSDFSFKGLPITRFDKPYVIDAIVKYFENNKE